MLGKLGLIIKREYLAKVRNKSFIVMTILSPLLIVGMIVLIAYLAKINDDEQRVVSVLNESHYFKQSFKNTKSLSFVQFSGLDLEKAKDSTKALGYHGLLYIPEGASLETVAASSYFYTQENPNTGVLHSLWKALFRKG